MSEDGFIGSIYIFIAVNFAAVAKKQTYETININIKANAITAHL